MAGDRGLSRTARRRLGLLAALVVLLHALALHGLTQLAFDPTLLRPMVAPMYTRVLQPEAPPPPPAQAPAPPAVASTRLKATPSTPSTTTRSVPEPEPPAEVAAEPARAPSSPPEPDPTLAQAPPTDLAAGTNEPTAAPPEVAASEPQPTAPPAVATPAAPPASVAASGTTPSLDTWPADTRLRFRLGGRFRSGELYGNARVLWQRQHERYQVRVEVDVTLLASLVMTSQGTVQPGGLLPEVYEEERRGRRRGLRMTEREVVLAGGTSVPRPPGVQDTASQFVELSHRFATGQAALEVGRSVSFWMARPGQVDLWTYDIVERKVLRTALGDVEAFHLKPRPIANPRGNITAEMWFAPSLQYLPVRIRVNSGDEAQIDLLVEGIEQR